MKKIVFLLFLIYASVSFAQLKEDVDKPLDIKSGIISKNQGSTSTQQFEIKDETKNSFLGIFNPANLTMHHTFGMSYSNFGSGFMTLGVYTNSLAYKFTDNLQFAMDASIVNTPYNSFGSDFSKQINGVYITKALLNYKISDNANISVEYRMLPMGLGLNPFNFGSFSRYGFNDDFFYGY